MVNYHWSDIEEVTLCNLVKAQGKQWYNIQQIYFPQLTVNQIKSKSSIFKKKLKTSLTLVMIQRNLQLIVILQKGNQDIIY
ncbi:Myb-like DNA-binding domain-containing protein [Spironucleus salmonicida]|uniref:Myb-like DNA-binding domain-containing protein n=1 Tax=Spironucleus salmonicida TaxID=348837 RepID=A0A9P8LXC9_9EUKA|nr:Myb-like DNA-binding domain-containing protein [Spironucleus salmonicida]